MTEDLKGYIHSVETSGAVDGPGIRFIVFFSGCALRCKYCHNPDMFKINAGKEYSVDEIFSEIKSYEKFLKRAKGGVTFSGGEPLLQAEFIEALTDKCKSIGLHVAIDTSGFMGHKASDNLLHKTDLFLLDVKSGLNDIYKKVTTVDLKNTLDFIERLNKTDTDVWVRFVLVPNLTDDEENMAAVAKIVKSVKNLKRFDVLPFHKMGEYKWQELGLEYELSDTESPTVSELKRAFAIFEKHGLKPH